MFLTDSKTTLKIRNCLTSVYLYHVQISTHKRVVSFMCIVLFILVLAQMLFQSRDCLTIYSTRVLMFSNVVIILVKI